MDMFERMLQWMTPVYNLWGMLYMIIMLLYGVYVLIKKDLEQSYLILECGLVGGISFLGMQEIVRPELTGINYSIDYKYLLLLAVYVGIISVMSIKKCISTIESQKEYEEDQVKVRKTEFIHWLGIAVLLLVVNGLVEAHFGLRYLVIIITSSFLIRAAKLFRYFIESDKTEACMPLGMLTAIVIGFAILQV